MRMIRRTAAFRRDYKREKRGQFAKTLPKEIRAVVADLAADQALPQRHHDHALTGPWKDPAAFGPI